MKQKFFDLARRISYKSSHHRNHLGAVIVNKSRVLSLGFNRCTTHPKSPHPYKHLHAEIDAIIGIDRKQLKGSTIYVYRENKQGTVALARPCQSCYDTIKLAGIKAICYTTYGGYKKEHV